MIEPKGLVIRNVCFHGEKMGSSPSQTASNHLSTPPTSSTRVLSGSSSNSSPSSSTTIHRKSIIGGVIGGLVLISLLIALFFFIRRRNNLKSQVLSKMTIMSCIDSPPDVVTPFTVTPSNPNSTFLPQNYTSTSNGQSLPSQFTAAISSKFTQMRQPSGPSSMSISGGIPPLTSTPTTVFITYFHPTLITSSPSYWVAN